MNENLPAKIESVPIPEEPMPTTEQVTKALETLNLSKNAELELEAIQAKKVFGKWMSTILMPVLAGDNFKTIAECQRFMKDMQEMVQDDSLPPKERIAAGAQLNQAFRAYTEMVGRGMQLAEKMGAAGAAPVGKHAPPDFTQTVTINLPPNTKEAKVTET